MAVIVGVHNLQGLRAVDRPLENAAVNWWDSLVRWAIPGAPTTDTLVRQYELFQYGSGGIPAPYKPPAGLTPQQIAEEQRRIIEQAELSGSYHPAATTVTVDQIASLPGATIDAVGNVFDSAGNVIGRIKDDVVNTIDDFKYLLIAGGVLAVFLIIQSKR